MYGDWVLSVWPLTPPPPPPPPPLSLSLQEFMSEGWSNAHVHVTMDTTILEYGFICASINSTPSLPPSSSPHPFSSLPCSSSPHLPPTPHMATKSTSIDKSVLENSSSIEWMRTYVNDTHEVTSCNVCRKGCTINNSGNDVNDCTININCEHAENICSGVSDGNLSKWNFPTLPHTSLAYVMHTSGTTGRPKPVRVPHCCIVPNIVDLTQRFSICPDDCIFNAAPLTFDPSVVEV